MNFVKDKSSYIKIGDKLTKKSFKYLLFHYPTLFSTNSGELPKNITKNLINKNGFKDIDEFGKYIYSFYKSDKNKKKYNKSIYDNTKSLKEKLTPFLDKLQFDKKVSSIKKLIKHPKPIYKQNTDVIKKELKLLELKKIKDNFKGTPKNYYSSNTKNKYGLPSKKLINAYIQDYIYEPPALSIKNPETNEWKDRTPKEIVNEISDYLKSPLFFGQNDLLTNKKKISIRLIFYVGESAPYTTSTAYKNNKPDLLINLEDVITKLLYKYDVVTLEDLEISIFTPKNQLCHISGGDSRNIERKFYESNFFEYSIPSTNNCGYHCIELAKNPVKFIEDNKNILKLQNRAKALKSEIKAKHPNNTNTLYTKRSDIQHISNHTKLEIVVHKSNLEIDYTIKPEIKSKDIRTKQKEPVHIVYRNNHYMALLEKDKYPELYTPEINLINDSDEEHDVLIKKRPKYDVEYNTKYASWDIEASIDELGIFKSYAVGIAYNLNSEIKYQSFWGDKCLNKFINYLFDNMESFNKYTFYAHNGGKFDVMLLFRECMGVNKNFQIYKDSCIEQNGRFIRFQITDGKNKITFLDSMCMFAGQSLKDITTSMKVKHQKLDEDVNHDEITLSNYKTFEKLPKYLEHDCKGLLEVLLSFSKDMFNSSKINMSDCTTSATYAKRDYKQNYLVDENNNYKAYIYTLAKEKDSFIRKSYYGGRNEVFLHNKHVKAKSYYYDFTSLFPSVGCQPLPCGKPYDFSFNNNSSFDNFYGFCEVYVKSRNTKIKPLHALYKDNKLVFQHFKEFTKMVLYSEEIRLGMKHDIYEYDFTNCKGIRFSNKSPFLKEYFEDAFKSKAEAKKRGDSVMELVYKIKINSGYGFWGLRVYDREVIKTTTDDTVVQKYFDNNKLLNYAEFGHYFSVKVEDDLPMKDFNVGVASAITSNARMELWSLINDIESKGLEVYYCDTDSIITNCKLNEHEDLMNRYCWDGLGDALGSLKNECKDKLIKYNKKNPDNKIDIDLQLKIDGGDLCFDEFKLNGCKFYAIRKTCYNGAVIEIVKCKGYRASDKKLNFDDFISDNIINQKQLQFLIPKSNLLNEDNKYAVKKNYINKSFKPYYSKGEIDLDTGIVNPYYN